jgi:hypothetical protein
MRGQADDDVRDEGGTYAHGRASFVAHGVAVAVLGVLAVLLIAGRRHTIASSGYFWLAFGIYLVGGAFTPRLRFGPVSRQRWLASHARVRRKAPQFGDRFVVRFDPFGRAFNFIAGAALIVYGVVRILGRA